MSGNSKLNSLKEFEKQLVYKYIAFTKSNRLEFATEAQTLALARTADIPAALAPNCLEKLCSNQIFLKEINLRTPNSIRIHSAFYEEATALYQIESESTIPAADRFVSIDDNQPILEETKVALVELSQAVSGANKLFATGEDQIQVSKEIDYVLDLISRPRIHILAVWDATKSNRVLNWLIEQSFSGAVRAAAAKAAEHLGKLLIHFMSRP
jgi:hypothetical protein